MKRKITFLTAAFVLLGFLAIPTGMKGQTSESYSVTYSYSDLEDMLSGSYTGAGSGTSAYWKVPETSGEEATISIPITYQPTSNITLTFNIATFGSGNNPSATNTTITAIGTEDDSNWTGSGLSTYPSSSTYVDGVMTMTMPDTPTTLGGLTVTMGVNTGVKIFRLKSVKVEYTYVAGPTSPEIVINSDELTLSYAENTDGSFNVTYTDDFEPLAAFARLYSDFECTEEFDGDWIGVEEEIENNVITYIVEANTSTEERTVYMYVEAMDAEYIINAVFTITQAFQPRYTVTYVANGGSGTMIDEDSPYHENDVVVLLDNAFNAPDGKIWDSWQVKDASNNDIEVDDGMFYMPASNVTVTAQWIDDPNAPVYEYEWVLTDLADLTSSDVFVIVGTNNGTFAMTNNRGTANPPAAVTINIVNDKIASTFTVSDTLKWNVSGDATNGYTFYPNGNSAAWLYCNTTNATGSNNNMRVGTGNRKVFVLDNDNNLKTKDSNATRYVCVYSAQDWRGYVSKSTTVAFYKRQIASTEPYVTADNVNIEYNVTSGNIAYEIHNPVDDGALTASTGSDWLTLGEVDETIPFTCDENPTSAARTATVTLTYTYGEESVTKDVTVTQALNPNVTMTIAEVRALATGHVVTTGIITSITGTNNKTAYMQDATAAIAIYGNFEAAVGDEVKVSGNLQTYKGLLEIGSNNNPPTVQVLSNGNTVAPTIKTIAEINADDYTSSNSIQGLYVTIENATVTGTMLVNGQYTTTIAQGENTIDVFGNLGVDVDLYDVLTLNGNIGCNNAAQIANPSNVEVASSGFNYYYSVNGELGDVLQGTDITLANSDAVGGLAFAGWTLDPNNVETILPAGDPYTITEENAGIVFYAVYSRSVDMADHTYVKITEEPEDWSGNYLIVYEDGNVAFNGGLQILDAENNTINVSINGDNIEGDYTTNAAVFTIAPIVDNEQVTGYSIKSRSGFYIGQTSNANGMKAHTSTVYNNSISYNVEEGIVDIISAGAYMRYNSSSGQERFRYFRSGTYSNQKAIQLYKQEGEAVLSNSYYTRVFANETATANIEIVGPSVIPSDYSLNMDTYTLTNELGAASLVIEEGGQLIHSVEENIVYVTMQKHINRYYGEKDNYYLIAAPFQVDPSTVSGMLDNDYDLYSFASWAPGEEWQNYEAEGGEFWLQEGQGFLYANNVDTDLEFVGQVAPSTDDDFYYGGLYDESSTAPFNGWSLAGNPFACNAYPVLNDGTAASFYKISGDELVLSEENYMRPLEGIFMQETDESTQYFFNRTEPAPSRAIDLTVMSVARGTANCDRVRVRFDNGNNFGKFQLNPNHTKLYFSQGNKDYAVVRSANEGEMPLNFKAETNGNYTISVDAENVNMSYLHLIDNVTGADVDLLATPSYSFEANTNDYATRFRLVFKANANVHENADADADTFAFFNGNEWVVSNIGEATLQVVDVMGRVLSSETINGNAEISIKQEPGVYMLRLINGDNVRTQKVVVK